MVGHSQQVEGGEADSTPGVRWSTVEQAVLLLHHQGVVTWGQGAALSPGGQARRQEQGVDTPLQHGHHIYAR